MVCYKDSQSAVNLDPVEWTGTWRDARPINREGALPENELTGTLFTANAQRVDAFAVPYSYRLMRLCTSLSGSISTISTVLSWISAGIYMCGALPCPVCA